MGEINIGAIQYEWLNRKAGAAYSSTDNPADHSINHSTGSSIEDYLLEKYLEFHAAEPESCGEKTAAFQRLVAQWKEKSQKFREAAGRYPGHAELEPWQAAEMLDNVMEELEMQPVEQYRYLLNIKLLNCYQLTEMAGCSSQKDVRAAFEQEYEEKWDASSECVSEPQLQELFAETVRLMQYAGISYSDDTRRILAEIGAGRQAEFVAAAFCHAQEDLQLLTDFLVFEMVASEMSGMYTEKEQEVMAFEVIPVCVSAAALARNESSPSRAQKLAQSALGTVFTKENAGILAAVAALSLAAQAVLLAAELAVAGTVVTIGIKTLWRWCRTCREQGLPIGYKIDLPGELQKQAEASEKEFLKEEDTKLSHEENIEMEREIL